MIEFEADDALAAAATASARDPRVDRIVICTPDKDLAQCVRGTRIVQMDRRRRTIRDEAGIVAKFGVSPASIPDYLALVGDAADGYPGLPGWGARSAAAVLSRFGHLESIPRDWREWKGVNAAKPGALAYMLEQERERAFLFRDLATLRCDIELFDAEIARGGRVSVDEDLHLVIADGKAARALELEPSGACALVRNFALFFADPLAVVEPLHMYGGRSRSVRQNRGVDVVVRLEAGGVRRDGVVAVQLASELEGADMQRWPACDQHDCNQDEERRLWMSHILNVA